MIGKFVRDSDCDILETVCMYLAHGVTVAVYSIKSVLNQNPACKV
jgi:hypothetical protein